MKILPSKLVIEVDEIHFVKHGAARRMFMSQVFDPDRKLRLLCPFHLADGVDCTPDCAFCYIDNVSRNVYCQRTDNNNLTKIFLGTLKED